MKNIECKQCPHCEKVLDKIPGKKKKCSFCSEYIYVRTRPGEKGRFLVKEDEIDKIDEEWAIENGCHNEFLQEKKREEGIRNEGRGKWGSAFSENDVKWRMLNEDYLKHVWNKDFGLARNSRLEMGDICKKERKLDLALNFYLEVCYLDLNGCINAGGYKDDTEMLKEYPPFDKTQAILAPGVIKIIKNVVEKQGLDEEKVKDCYLATNKQVCRSALNPPLEPLQCWETLRHAIFPSD